MNTRLAWQASYRAARAESRKMKDLHRSVIAESSYELFMAHQISLNKASEIHTALCYTLYAKEWMMRTNTFVLDSIRHMAFELKKTGSRVWYESVKLPG